jgi:hypothetical protein
MRFGNQKKIYAFLSLCVGLMIVLGACAPETTDNQSAANSTATVNPAFQKNVSPVPTVPTYRCGAWASNNAPSSNSTITIYARITKDIAGVAGASAAAVAHLKNGDVPLSQRPTSDSGGYVTFSLSLSGRQPSKQPATVDVTFTVGSNQVSCSPAFFTPQ